MKWDNNWDWKTKGAFKNVRHIYGKEHPAWAKKDEVARLEERLKQLKAKQDGLEGQGMGASKLPQRTSKQK